MDFLGIGFWELVFIFIVAMMVFGPRRLPEIASKAGKIVRDLRGMSQGLMAEWQREITVAARLDELQKVRQELEEAKQEITQAQQEIGKTRREVSAQTQEDLQQIRKNLSATAPAKAATANTEPAQNESETDNESPSDSAQPSPTNITQPQINDSPEAVPEKEGEQIETAPGIIESPEVPEPNGSSAPPVEPDSKSPASVDSAQAATPPKPKEILNE